MVAATVASGQDPDAASHRRQPDHRIGRPPADQSGDARRCPRDDAVGGHQRHGEGHRGLGDVHGKTGEAEFAGGSHAWFAGYRGSGIRRTDRGRREFRIRGPMVRSMFDELPVDYS